MRIAVIILGLVTSQVLFDLTGMAVHLDLLLGAAFPPPEAMGSLGLLAGWIGGLALAYPAPGVAWWLFALAGGAGYYAGVTHGPAEVLVWGGVAVGLAVLTRLARWEQRVAEQREWARTQHELAVHAALRSLHETVPELLIRGSVADVGDHVPSGLVTLRPPTVRDAARR